MDRSLSHFDQSPRPASLRFLLSASVCAMVVLLLVPVPPFGLDILVCANLAVGALILVGATQIRDPLGLPFLPQVLVLTTFFRLVTNVSTTRMILTRADPGRVVQAFGTIVVGYDFLVGTCLFLILAAIQFLVIARGTERVAEVAARFTLDAIPGRQLAIDSDLRGGAISPEGAARQRDLLIRESRLFGSMDGASRFVKGDAMAGLLIAAVNMGAGLVIGVLRHKLPLNQALERFATLTVGDTLAIQIPALMTALAAALLVTRMATQSGGSADHGREETLLFPASLPSMLLMVAGLFLLLALIPQFPFVPFGILSAVLTASGVLLHRRSRRPWSLFRRGPSPDSQPQGQNLVIGLPAVLPAQRAMAMVEGLRDTLGVPYPVPRCVRMEEDEAPLPWIRTGDISYRMEEAEPIKPSSQLTSDERLDRILRTLLLKAAPTFLGIQETHERVEALSRTHPALIRATVPKVVDLPTLTLVLRELVADEYSVRNLHPILEALAQCRHLQRPAAGTASSGRNPTVQQDALVEAARHGLRHQLAHKLNAHPGCQLPILLLHPLVTDSLRQGTISPGGNSHQYGQGAAARLSPDQIQDLVSSIDRGASLMTARGHRPVLLADPSIRRPLAELLRPLTASTITIVGPGDLDPQVRLIPLATAGADPDLQMNANHAMAVDFSPHTSL